MFRSSKRRTAGRKNFEQSNIVHDDSYISKLYSSKLTFYQLPPQGEITLDQFEIWAIDRIKVLNEIESQIVRNKSYKDIESSILPLLQQQLPLNSSNPEKLKQDRQKDYYSHFILRLCFARSKELRDKFIKNETILLKIRFQQLSQKDQQSFVKSLNLPWDFITQDEKSKISDQLFKSIAPSLQYQLQLNDEHSKKQFFDNENFIKLPFEHVIDLVSSRSIYLYKGYGYIPQFQQLKLITNEYEKHLMDSLLTTAHAFPSLDEDDRLLPILQHLSTNSNVSYQPDFESNSSDITASSIYSKKIQENLPLCGSQLMQGLHSTGHLKYIARQQFTLFLKGIGLNLDQALEFWQNEFSKSMSQDKFQKEYSYNIRHSYGKEGSRVNYKPWDCRTILSKPRPAKGEFHGCPYRDLSTDVLTSKLGNMGLENKDIMDIVEISTKGEFTNACTKVLELKSGINEVVVHPNLYFDRMRQAQKAE
ncbi:DNA primase large subunit [Wickerhamomyces ciferrii]|uniref:DNA primase large subunit n=1 Tax=Wickerhamomyces ciferrii (strain ATCC 14091 / BCRC 22168 / CBS 111 / JCM 3599 / NBRC 0793 / NRRL Y-1031 F-60-10) TaxID=1206466 RepID=K0KYF8_WICCF|nr:DNA primase large subunit [Wickerhamomyces ciferrii]CCH47112.1 DNA primase large subunit [Wickerhamomyces ciferrii]